MNGTAVPVQETQDKQENATAGPMQRDAGERYDWAPARRRRKMQETGARCRALRPGAYIRTSPRERAAGTNRRRIVMRIEQITLHRICLQLKSPFATSYGAYTDRETILVEVRDESGATGWGECVAFATPWYTEETVETAWHMMERYLIPTLLHCEIAHPDEVLPLFAFVRRHHMAKAGLEMAVWDLYARRRGQPLATVIGGVRQQIETGVAVGLQETPEKLYRVIEQYLADGYRRIKVKIKPGHDVELVRGIRAHFPDLPLMADANSAYTLEDVALLKQLDDFGLMMIEQPLAADDIVDHAELQKQLRTPICLDESLVACEDVRKAIMLGSCRVVNVKIGRVGGLSEAVRIHDLCHSRGVPLWCGGMLETGVGRAHNIALATLPGFTLPGDISASSRYWERDIIVPEVTVSDGRIAVPDRPGIGYEMDRDYLRHVSLHVQTYR